MICPHCIQGEIILAVIKKTNEIIKICDECDTLWEEYETISEETGTAMWIFMPERDCQPLWNELDLKGKL